MNDAHPNMAKMSASQPTEASERHYHVPSHGVPSYGFSKKCGMSAREMHHVVVRRDRGADLSLLVCLDVWIFLGCEVCWAGDDANDDGMTVVS